MRRNGMDKFKREISDTFKEKSTGLNDIQQLNKNDIDKLHTVGVDAMNESQAGNYVLFDDHFLCSPSQIEGVEIIPLNIALEKYNNICEKYFYDIEKADHSQETECSEKVNGFFIWVKKGVKVDTPLHTGFLMRRDGSEMKTHNIIVLEEDSSLQIVTGCTSGSGIKKGSHTSTSKYFVGKKAQLVNTMINSWGAEFNVQPGSETIVEDNGIYISNYYSVRPPKKIVMNPFIHLKGSNSKSKQMSVVLCLPETYSDIGGTVLMSGENTGAEIVARAVNHGGTVKQNGLLIGAGKNARAHIDCSGLMLSDSGIIEAVPGLRSVHPDARMSHEAAIGKIDAGEINYLQSKGLDEMEAVSLIVRGFLGVINENNIMNPELESMIRKISESSGHGDN